MLRLPTLLCAALVVLGCNERPSERYGMPTADELPQLRAQALAGSRIAARKLSLWHMKLPDGKNTYEYWTQVGANNEDAIAQYNLAMIYLLDKPDVPGNKERGLFWLEKAAAGGSTKAAAELRARTRVGENGP